jgi:hypothetical protein
MKKFFLFFLLISLVFTQTACTFFGKDPNIEKKENVEIKNELNEIEEIDPEQEIFDSTINISKNYLKLRIETDDILKNAKNYSDYKTWNDELEKIILNWEKLEKDALLLEEKAQDYIKVKTSFKFFIEVKAYSKQEISNVFDKAPAGKKIITLAKFLGVDAKRAFQILKQDQAQVEADAWNEAGDTFKKLETSAIVIKDGCKVAGFVGGVIISGGTAGFAGASALTQTAVVVSGVDLALEVTEDGANIALGNNNKVAEIVGDVRKITEPLATFLTITSVPENLASGFDKFNATMLALEQLRSSAQEGKVVGIALPAYKAEKNNNAKIEAVVIEKEEIENWLKENGYTREDRTPKEILVENKENQKDEVVEEEEKEEIKIEENILVNENEKNNNTTKKSESGISVSFISPSEDSFQKGQARMWKLELNNLPDYDSRPGFSHVCHWFFYLDGVLYREMPDNRGCAFTSTFIEKTGNLTVEARVDFLQGRSIFDEDGNFEYVKDVVESITVSRDFSVVK